jgi:hypothetical protein
MCKMQNLQEELHCAQVRVAVFSRETKCTTKQPSNSEKGSTEERQRSHIARISTNRLTSGCGPAVQSSRCSNRLALSRTISKLAQVSRGCLQKQEARLAATHEAVALLEAELASCKLQKETERQVSDNHIRQTYACSHGTRPLARNSSEYTCSCSEHTRSSPTHDRASRCESDG